jgi:hypothetical protein
VPTRATDLLSLLHGHSLIRSIRIVHYDETPAGQIELKVRCRLSGNYQFQIWLHIGAASQDYAYQLFDDRALLRWDNAPHYPNIATAPHHFHDEGGSVRTSTLRGDPLLDLPSVLTEIERWLTQH